MGKFFRGLAGAVSAFVLFVALIGVMVVPRPAPAPVAVVEVQIVVEPEIDAVLETVYAYVAPKLHGVGGRSLPPVVARAIVVTLVQRAREEGFDPFFVAAVVEVESRWDIDAVSPTGARGLMQLLPATFVEVSKYHTTADPVENVRAGIAYLALLYKNGAGFVRPESILRAYNGGPGTAMLYNKVIRAKGDLSTFSTEVREYPSRVMHIYRRLVQSQGGNFKRPDKTWRIP